MLAKTVSLLLLDFDELAVMLRFNAVFCDQK